VSLLRLYIEFFRFETVNEKESPYRRSPKNTNKRRLLKGFKNFLFDLLKFIGDIPAIRWPPADMGVDQRFSDWLLIL
jgi:hypothetical protein